MTDCCSSFSSLNLSVGEREQSFSKREFGVSPACLHGDIEGLFGLFRTRQGGVQLLTHLLGHVKVEGMTALSLHQEHLGIAARARIHCRERERERQTKPFWVLSCASFRMLPSPNHFSFSVFGIWWKDDTKLNASGKNSSF